LIAMIDIPGDATAASHRVVYICRARRLRGHPSHFSYRAELPPRGAGPWGRRRRAPGGGRDGVQFNVAYAPFPPTRTRGKARLRLTLPVTPAAVWREGFLPARRFVWGLPPDALLRAMICWDSFIMSVF